MKNLFQLIILIFLLLPREGKPQGMYGENPFGGSTYTSEPVKVQTFKVYATDYGVPQILPSYKAVQIGNTTKVYQYNQGVLNPLPVLKITRTENFIKAVEYDENGIPNIWASYLIKIE